MSEYLKNNPIGLRHCLLYRFLQEEPIEKSYEGFCKVLGSDVIDFEDFKLWFDRFAEGRFNETEEPMNLLEMLQNDKNALRACILYESLRAQYKDFAEELLKMMATLFVPPDCRKRESAVFNSYKRMCKVVGYDVITYQQFEFWFYRFENGLFDLNFEPDPKKKILELRDIPTDIVKLFVEKLNYFDRCCVAKVSRDLRHLVHSTPLTLENFRIDFLDEGTRFNFESPYAPWSITFVSKENGCQVSYLNSKTEISGDHLNAALNDIRLLLKSRKLKIRNFILNFEFESDLPDFTKLPILLEEQRQFRNFRKIDEFFKSLNAQIHVERLKMEFDEMDPVMTVLPYLKPGVLEKIEFEGRGGSIDHIDVTGRMIETEQWKRAKEFKMANCPTFYHCIGNLLHFNVFSVYHPNLSAQELEMLRICLHMFPEFKSGTILFNDDEHFDFSVMEREFGAAVSQNTYRHPVPDSKEYFEIKLMEDQLTIQRIG